MKKYLFIVSIALIYVAGVFIASISCKTVNDKPISGNKGGAQDISEYTDNLLQGFPVRVADYTYYDRQLYLSDFSAIQIGSNYKDIIESIGTPNGMVGSGLLSPYYQLIDSSCVTLFFLRDAKGEFTSLYDIKITDVSGRTFELKKAGKEQ